MGEAEQLVRRAKKRDPDAFTELMQLHEKDMYRTASAILSRKAESTAEIGKLLQLIDLEHKDLYIYERIQREIERGERTGFPDRYAF